MYFKDYQSPEEKNLCVVECINHTQKSLSGIDICTFLQFRSVKEKKG